MCVCVCECCAGNVQFVASTGWREKFIRRHPEVRTKVTEVGEYFVGTVMLQNLPCTRVGGMNSDVVGKYLATLGALIQEVSAEFIYESSYIVWVA